MLQLILIFLVLALISGSLGLSGVAILSAQMARLLFTVFIVLFLISLLAHVFGYAKKK